MSSISYSQRNRVSQHGTAGTWSQKALGEQAARIRSTPAMPGPGLEPRNGRIASRTCFQTALRHKTEQLARRPYHARTVVYELSTMSRVSVRRTSIRGYVNHRNAQCRQTTNKDDQGPKPNGQPRTRHHQSITPPPFPSSNVPLLDHLSSSLNHHTHRHTTLPHLYSIIQANPSLSHLSDPTDRSISVHPSIHHVR